MPSNSSKTTRREQKAKLRKSKSIVKKQSKAKDSFLIKALQAKNDDSQTECHANSTQNHQQDDCDSLVEVDFLEQKVPSLWESLIGDCLY